jgi:hypothetical protein
MSEARETFPAQLVEQVSKQVGDPNEFPIELIIRCSRAPKTRSPLRGSTVAAVLRESGHKELVEALRGYEAWEADLILTGDWKSEFPRMTAAQYDKMIELQTKRNEALRKAGLL